MKKVIIEITKNCIRRGQRSNPNSCPVALGVSKYLNKHYRTSVNSWGGIGIEPSIWGSLSGSPKDADKWPFRIADNKKRMKFIQSFDNIENPKNKFQPFSFIVKLPEEFLKPQYK